MAGRIIETNFTPEDSKVEETLRPQLLDDYIGQQKAKENMKVFIEAAKQRGDSLDHVLLYGPPGLSPISQTILDKHYLRKHGKNAYYGQGKQL